MKEVKPKELPFISQSILLWVYLIITLIFC